MNLLTYNKCLALVKVSYPLDKDRIEKIIKYLISQDVEISDATEFVKMTISSIEYVVVSKQKLRDIKIDELLK